MLCTPPLSLCYASRVAVCNAPPSGLVAPCSSNVSNDAARAWAWVWLASHTRSRALGQHRAGRAPPRAGALLAVPQRQSRGIKATHRCTRLRNINRRICSAEEKCTRSCRLPTSYDIRVRACSILQLLMYDSLLAKYPNSAFRSVVERLNSSSSAFGPATLSACCQRASHQARI